MSDKKEVDKSTMPRILLGEPLISIEEMNLEQVQEELDRYFNNITFDDNCIFCTNHLK